MGVLKGTCSKMSLASLDLAVKVSNVGWLQDILLSGPMMIREHGVCFAIEV